MPKYSLTHQKAEQRDFRHAVLSKAINLSYALLPTGTAFSPSLSLCVFYTYRCVVTSNTPRVVMRRLGITGSAMKLSVMNGSMPVDTPSS